MLRAVGLLLLTLAALVLVALSRGVYDEVPFRARPKLTGHHRAPGWVRPCFRLREDYRSSLGCARVSGRVVLVEDVDSDGDGDRHLVLVSRLRPRIVKLARDFPLERLPRRGSVVRATGVLLKGASGREELKAATIAFGGRTVTVPAG